MRPPPHQDVLFSLEQAAGWVCHALESRGYLAEQGPPSLSAAFRSISIDSSKGFAGKKVYISALVAEPLTGSPGLGLTLSASCAWAGRPPPEPVKWHESKKFNRLDGLKESTAEKVKKFVAYAEDRFS